MAGDPFDEAVRETKRAARQLLDATETLSLQMARTAKEAVNQPGPTARKAADRVSKELHQVVDDIDRILRDL